MTASPELLADVALDKVGIVVANDVRSSRLAGPILEAGRRGQRSDRRAERGVGGLASDDVDASGAKIITTAHATGPPLVWEVPV